MIRNNEKIYVTIIGLIFLLNGCVADTLRNVSNSLVDTMQYVAWGSFAIAGVGALIAMFSDEDNPAMVAAGAGVLGLAVLLLA